MGKRFRILAMDGGPAGPTYSRFLREIESRKSGVLQQVDLFAGTSDGATFACYFAGVPRAARNLELIDDAIAFNRELFAAIEPRCVTGYLRLVTLVLSADAGRRVQRCLEEHLGREVTLRELASNGGYVAVISFRMRQPWGAKVYHNFGQDDPDLDERVAEVVNRSAAFPVLVPVRDGHIDGGVFANNPSMCAITQVLSQRKTLGGRVKSVDDIVVLSLGGESYRIGGRLAQRGYALRRLQWGAAQWVIWPFSPGLILEALVNAGDRGTSFQARQLLDDRYFRLAIPGTSFVEGVADVFLRRAASVLARAERTAKQWASGTLDVAEWDHDGDGEIDFPSIDATLEWLDKHWFD